MEVYLMNCGEDYSPYLNKMSERAKRRVAELCANPARAIQTAFADLALYIIAKRKGLETPLNVCEEQDGKPYINKKPFEFSVSHCKKLIAIAVDNKPCGADVELLRPVDAKTARKTLNILELKEYIEQSDDSVREKIFFKYFTTKESYVKFKGEGFKNMPAKISDYSGAKFCTKYMVRDSEVYCITLCSSDFESLSFHFLTLGDINK